MSKEQSDPPASWGLEPNYRVDLFAGTAEYYARFRPPYPPALIEHLTRRARISGQGRLLDLACGTGEVALAMYGSFAEVWAQDQEKEMIEMGQRKAGEVGAHNLRWLVGRAEDLEAPSGQFELVTIGSAFHRLDRLRVAQLARQWLPPGGYLAILGANSVWTGTERWQSLAVEVIERWTPARSKGQGASMTHQEVLAGSGYTDIGEERFSAPQRWTLDSFLGYLYSTSITSRAALGEKLPAFEADLRRALLSHDSSGIYQEQVQFSCMLARNTPAAD